MAYWICLLILCVIYIMFKHFKVKQYYVKQGVPQIPEIPILGLFGSNFLTQRSMNDLAKIAYNTDPKAKYFVSFSFFSPSIIIRDLDLIKSVLVTNFDYFAFHVTIGDEKNDPLLSKNLALLNGDKWREVRNMLSPAFTSSKMRAMHVLMSNCAENFTKKLLHRYGKVDEIDIKDLFSKFTTDVIATCAFGIEVDSLDDPNNEFYLSGKKSSFNNAKTFIKFILIMIFPKLMSKLGIKIVSDNVTNFFVNTIDRTIKIRDEKGITRPDMLQLMMDSRDKLHDSSRFDIMEMTANAFIFFLAGFDTASDTMSLMAHELAVNPDVQEKLRAEINVVMEKYNEKPTYEAINNMHYLDAVFNETMRMHSLAFVSRVCSKDFELPPSVPNSKPMMVKSGTEVVIPIAAIHRDPNYYENPDKFDPDRYLNKKVTSDVLNLGFGLGPRMCIGSRFAILEIKTLFVHLLNKYSLEACKKTCIPFQYNPNVISPCPKGGFWLQIKPREC